jgi:hypothetical protein
MGKLKSRAALFAGVIAMLGAMFTAIGPAHAATCSLALSPTLQSQPVGGTATFVATATCGGVAAPGKSVLLAVVGGVNSGLTRTGTTGADGTATLMYSSAAAGSDGLLASTDANTVVSNGVGVTWGQNQLARAFGISATGLLPVAAQPDTGTVSTTGDVTTPPNCVLNYPSALLSANVMCVQAWTGSAATSSPKRGALAGASLKTLTLAVPGVPVISVIGLAVTSGTQCDIGSKAVSTIATLRVGLTSVIGGESNPAPNTTIPLGVGTLILNEQKPVPGASAGVTVNGLHLIVPGVTDLIVSSATSAMFDCPRP